MQNFDESRAGTRLRILRHLNHMTRAQLCKSLGYRSDRLRNLEDLKQKLNEDDFQKITELWPNCSDYLTRSGPLKLDPTCDIVKDRTSTTLLNNPEHLEKAQQIKDLTDLDMVRAALTIPEFRDLIYNELDLLLDKAKAEAKENAR